MNSTINKHALTFGFISVFLTGLGLTIVSPVLPFIVETYTTNAHSQATVVTLLMATYALAVFLAAPLLGKLSDRYGRRPVMILSLLGSAFGYFIFGLGGSIMLLFIGRLIEGITGGEISAIFAYFSDITPVSERTKYFGWISALVGVGTAIGPSLGGFLAKFGNHIPMYAGAVITLLNAIYGYFFMPETLDKSQRLTSLSIQQMNPLRELVHLLTQKAVKWLLLTGFFIWVPNGSLQAIFSQFSIDTFAWQPTFIGFLFSILGILDIFSQAFIMPRMLTKLSDKQIATVGMISETIGYGLIALSAIFSVVPIFIIGMALFGIGDAIFGPAFNGLLSKSVAANEQGRVQGGAQSIQAFARVIGPVIGGQGYAIISHTMPAFMGMILISMAIMILTKKQ
jgi:DHA1 family tetracycline resistance protein-like MFS transporter